MESGWLTSGWALRTAGYFSWRVYQPWELLDLESVRCAQNRVKSQRFECVLTARGGLGGARSLFSLLCLRISCISWLVLLVARDSLLNALDAVTLPSSPLLSPLCGRESTMAHGPATLVLCEQSCPHSIQVHKVQYGTSRLWMPRAGSASRLNSSIGWCLRHPHAFPCLKMPLHGPSRGRECVILKRHPSRFGESCCGAIITVVEWNRSGSNHLLYFASRLSSPLLSSLILSYQSAPPRSQLIAPQMD